MPIPQSPFFQALNHQPHDYRYRSAHLAPLIESSLHKKINSIQASPIEKKHLLELTLNTKKALRQLDELTYVAYTHTNNNTKNQQLIMDMQFYVLQLTDSATEQATLINGQDRPTVATQLKSALEALTLQKKTHVLNKHSAYLALVLAIATLGLLVLAVGFLPSITSMLSAASVEFFMGTTLLSHALHMLGGFIFTITGILLIARNQNEVQSTYNFMQNHQVNHLEQFANQFLDDGPFAGDIVRDDYLPNGAVIEVTPF